MTACMPVGPSATAVVSVRACRSMAVPAPAPIDICCTCSIWDWSMPPVSLSMPMMPPRMPRIMPVRIIHSRNCVRATRATPMILPNISSVDLTEDTRTSTTRLDFSSMTLFMTMPLKRAMNMYRAMARTIDTIM